jgi:magnesium chelatase family protein
MSTSHLQSVAFWGMDAELVDVEADVKKGEKGHILIVGLPDTAVKESKDRVMAALKNSGFSVGSLQCTINLAPADLKKEGALYDLPIALSLLIASEQLPSAVAADFLFVGELSLTGQMRPMRGALSAALLARKLKKKGIFLPKQNADEAAAVQGIQVISVENLAQAAQFFRAPTSIQAARFSFVPTDENEFSVSVDFSEIKGQIQAKRGLEIAASGGHNLLLFGPPGTGKTLLAKALAGILPPLSLDESLEITKVHSLAGLLEQKISLVKERPFRNPHHTISAIGLIGGGRVPRPGELSLAHLGVLFLDELPEFSRHTLEVLRQPLENGNVTITRANTSLTFPTLCLFVAAMNPCPCGYSGHPQKPCKDSAQQIHRYRSKISGPLLDRIDMHLEVPHIPFQDLSSKEKLETSSDVRKRVALARSLQKERFKREKLNAQMSPQELSSFCTLSKPCEALLKQAMDKMSLSARAYTRILKVARTIADLDGKASIDEEHLMEALGFRSWSS